MSEDDPLMFPEGSLEAKILNGVGVYMVVAVRNAILDVNEPFNVYAGADLTWAVDPESIKYLADKVRASNDPLTRMGLIPLAKFDDRGYGDE